MARPQKKGLDYFPLDVICDKTDDVEILEAKYPTSGFLTLIKLYMKIYQEEGYYIKWNEKSSLLLSKRVNVDFNTVNDIINDLAEWDVFDNELYKTYKILTSKRIQETYIDAVKKRKMVEMYEEYYLLTEVNSNINLINVGINPQSKVKKSKVDKSKVNEEPPLPKKSLDFSVFSLEIKNLVKDFVEEIEECYRPQTDAQKYEWIDTIRKVIEIDNIPLLELKTIIEYARTDEFWSKQFNSILKLRKKSKNIGTTYVKHWKVEVVKNQNNTQTTTKQVISNQPSCDYSNPEDLIWKTSEEN